MQGFKHFKSIWIWLSLALLQNNLYHSFVISFSCLLFLPVSEDAFEANTCSNSKLPLQMLSQYYFQTTPLLPLPLYHHISSLLLETCTLGLSSATYTSSCLWAVMSTLTSSVTFFIVPQGCFYPPPHLQTRTQKWLAHNDKYVDCLI